MTDDFDDTNAEHRQIRLGIEHGDGIAQMYNIAHGLQAMRDAGFTLELHEDLAATSDTDPAPWYWPLDGDGWRHASTMGDLLKTFRMTRFGRWAAHGFMAALETVGLAPPGTKKTGDSLSKAAEALVQGGKEGLFTPMFLMVARKPLEQKKDELI